MARRSSPPRDRKAPKDTNKKVKRKVCVFCANGVDFIDYKDVNLLRRFMSDRAKIRARRVTGNCAQHQSDVAMAIKLARELALLPYVVRVTSSRGGGRGGRARDDRNSDERSTLGPAPDIDTPDGPVGGDADLEGEIDEFDTDDLVAVAVDGSDGEED